eukprot:155814_1
MDGNNISNCFHYSILIPFVSYYLFKFNQNKDEMIIFKRYANIVIYINILVLVYLLIDRPMEMLVLISPLREQRLYYLGTMWNLTYLAPYFVIWLFLARFWLMFYDLKHAKSTANSRWKLYLDPALVEGDFWTKYHLLGSMKYTLMIAFILWFLTTLLWFIPSQMSLHIDYWDNGPLITAATMMIGLVHLICCVFCSVIWCKTPRISDVFHLRYELKLLIISFWVTVVWFITLLVIEYMINQSTGNEAVLYTFMVVRTFSASVSYVVYSSVSTVFILNKLETECKAKSASFQKLQNVCDIILHKEYFELFVHHLIREFSMELILCFVELIQFKQQLNTAYSLDKQSIETIPEDQVTFEGEMVCLIDFRNICLQLNKNPNIPKSDLIYGHINHENETNIETYLRIAFLLFDKYINNENCSELEINISGEMRSEYLSKMCDMESFINQNKSTMKPDQLFEYFDVVIEELHQLLSFSFGRFMRSDLQINVARPILVDRDTEQLEAFLKPRV